MLTNRQDVLAELELEKVPDSEPLLFLRGTDPFASETARHYARLHREHGGDPDAAAAAEQHAEALEAWPNKQTE